MINQWKISLIKNFSIKVMDFTTLYADNQVVIARSEDELQEAVFKLGNVVKSFYLRISTSKTKVMAFCGAYPVRAKIIVENTAIEQVNSFTYLGCEYHI